MGARLELKHGLVAEADRLGTSADAALATEPATGSKVRTKGNLYLLVNAAGIGGRLREACALVADTIRREYYYDESAGIPICLEKAIRSANRRLRGSREGSGMPPGVIGIAIAVVRSNELYVATVGEVDAYLVRAARLLMPEHGALPGLPADDGLRLDVWRGELAVGDSLLLVSRNVTSVVGTEELKNAVVTLHPQSAVEHLHHLFVAAGGDGSDAVLAVEATELAAARGDRRLAPNGRGSDAFGDLGAGGPIPGGEQVVGAAAALGGAFTGATGAVTGAVGGIVDRFLDLMPQRPTSARRITSQVSRAESQRRAAIALLALLAVILVLGLIVWVFPRGQEDPVVNLPAGERAFIAAQEGADRAARTLTSDPEGSLAAYRQAWLDVQRASATGVPGDRTEPLAATIREALDDVYATGHPRADALYVFDDDANPVALVRGPDRAAYFIDAAERQVWRVDRTNDSAKEIVRPGDGVGQAQGIGQPRLLALGGVDLLIADARGELWKWRPSNDRGDGSLKAISLGGQHVWGDDVVDMATWLVPGGADDNLYNLYVLDPSTNQILRYLPTLGGNSFSAPGSYLDSDNEDVTNFRRMYIDDDVYTLSADGLVRHAAGAIEEFELETPPDDGDLRPGHDYRFLDGLGESREGRLYVYDAKWGRVVVFRKSTGEYLAQWSTTGRAARMGDARGMYVFQNPGSDGQTPPVQLVWITPEGLYQSPLVDVPTTEPSAGETRAPRETRRPKTPTP